MNSFVDRSVWLCSASRQCLYEGFPLWRDVHYAIQAGSTVDCFQVLHIYIVDAVEADSYVQLNFDVVTS